MKSERYHGPLITNGVSLTYIKLFPWITLFISSVSLWGTSFIDKVGVVKLLFIICSSFSILSIFLSFFRKIIYNFQAITYIFIAIIVLILIIDMNFIGLMMLVGNEGLYSLGSAIYTVAILIIFTVSCSIYTWYYLPKNQGKVWKFNQKGTKDKKSAFANNFWIVFGAVVLVPPLLTGYLENAFGFFLGILMTTTLSAVVVDAIYEAIYVRKHPNEDAF